MCKNNYSEAMKKTKEQRQAEILPVIKTLNKMHIKPGMSDSVKGLYKRLQDFINDGERDEIEYPMEELNLRVYGVLEKNVNRKTWLKIGAIEKLAE